MDILNDSVLGGAPIRYGAGSATMVMSASGATVAVKKGSGSVTMVMAGQGNGTAVRFGRGSCAMAMSSAGRAPPIRRGTGSVGLVLAASYHFPTPHVIPAGFARNKRTRCLLVATERREFSVSVERRTFVVAAEQHITIRPDAARSL